MNDYYVSSRVFDKLFFKISFLREDEEDGGGVCCDDDFEDGRISVFITPSSNLICCARSKNSNIE